MISKVLDKDTSLAEKIQTLYREQDNMITSILTAIGIAIGILAELLPPGSVAAGITCKTGGNDKTENVKEWLRCKLKPWQGY